MSSVCSRKVGIQPMLDSTSTTRSVGCRSNTPEKSRSEVVAMAFQPALVAPAPARNSRES
jgi:hypothetical protein